uniref:Integrase, catalytic region, zinc finger, CCHC-type, peptidase aspartic, catalytic n=1 Tax=Tanacetum cinerariifolium TaxID=118510 RepID=A0A6L2JUI5_TANCI|nr:hypothetical protein [Tanacetum cinerariifolium]
MTTLVERMIVVGVKNCPPMMDKSMYDSWQSHMLLYIKGKKNGRMMLESIENKPLVYPTIKENGAIRPKKYSELSEEDKLQDDCDVQAISITLQGLSPDAYCLVNHHKAAKDIWDRVNLLMKGTELSYQERECKLYNVLDKFTSVKGETLYTYYLRFAQLINDMNIIGMTMQQVQDEGHIARQCTQPKRLRNSVWFKVKMLRVQAHEFGQELDEEQLAFLADPGLADGQATQTTISHNVAFQTDDLDAYNSNCDDISSAKAVFMANLSSYESDVLSEVPNSDTYQLMIRLIKDRNTLKQEIDSLKQTLSKYVKEKESLLQTFIVFKNESKEKERKNMDKEIDLEKKMKELDNIVYKVGQSAQTPTLYDGSVISKKHDVISMVDEEETLILEEENRSKMLAKQNDLISKEKKINISLINYSELNKLAEDFRKCSVPQKELSAEQAFWLQLSNPNFEQLDVPHTPVKIEVPKELPKVSLVNTSFQKLKYHLASFGKVVKQRTTHDAITEGLWGFEHTKVVFLTHIILFLNSLKTLFKDFSKGLHEITEVQMLFNKMEAVVEQCSTDKKHFDIQKKEIFLDNDRLLEHIIGRDVIFIVMHADIESKCVSPENDNRLAYAELEQSYLAEYSENLKLKAELAKKKDVIEKEEHADTLREIVKNARALRPLDSNLDSACKFVQRIQEVLVYVKDTCLGLTKPSEKLVAITPLNKNKKVRFAKYVTYASNIQTQVDSYKTQDSNKPLLPSIGVISSTSASGSKPTCNTKKNMISQTSSRNKKNKVEDHPRSIKSKSIKKNYVIEPVCNANVKDSILNANSELVCATCNECMFDAIHDLYILDFVNDVNVRSKSIKRSKTRTTWKPTGKVFTNIGYMWKPIGRTFTIDRKKCPLTRITPTKVVPHKETCLTPVTIPNPTIKIYRMRTKVAKSVKLSSEHIILEFNISNKSEPNKSRGSNTLNVPSSSLVDFRLSKLFSGIIRFGNDQIAKIMSYGDYQMGNVTISRVYYVERLGHNLFSAGQFYDSDLEVALCKHTYFIRGLEGKSKKHSHKPKAEDSIQEKLYLLNMDLCEPMRIQSINGRKYVLVIVDDYSRFTLVKFHDQRMKFQRLMPNPLSPTPYVPPTKNDWDLLFQPMFDEYFNPPPSVVSPVPTVVAPEPTDPTGTPFLTSIDQDALSPSTSQTLQESQSLVISPGIEEEFHDIEVAHLDNDPFVGVPIPEPSFKESSSINAICGS